MRCIHCQGKVEMQTQYDNDLVCMICGRPQVVPVVNRRPFIVGRVDGANLPGVMNRTRTFQFEEEASRFVGQQMSKDMEGVLRGDYYIDAAP